MATEPNEIDEIRRMMSQIRHELHEDVQGVIEGAEAAADWRSYIRDYPWAAVGAVFAVGYLFAPRRRRRPAPTIHLAPAEVARSVGVEPSRFAAMAPEPKKKGKGLFRTLIGMVAPLALKAGQGYAMQFLEQWLAQQMVQQSGPLQGMAAAFGQATQGPPPQAPPRSPYSPGRPPEGPRF